MLLVLSAIVIGTIGAAVVVRSRVKGVLTGLSTSRLGLVFPVTLVDMHGELSKFCVRVGSRDRFHDLLDASRERAIEFRLESGMIPGRFESVLLEANDVIREVVALCHLKVSQVLFGLDLDVGDAEHTTKLASEAFP
jgi:hypothetical protein